MVYLVGRHPDGRIVELKVPERRMEAARDELVKQGYGVEAYGEPLVPPPARKKASRVRVAGGWLYTVERRAVEEEVSVGRGLLFVLLAIVAWVVLVILPLWAWITAGVTP
jgi:hypothetical protein